MIGLSVLAVVVLAGLVGVIFSYYGTTSRSRQVIEKQYRAGCCARCGYDVRESRECCPECGDPLLQQAIAYWKTRV